MSLPMQGLDTKTATLLQQAFRSSASTARRVFGDIAPQLEAGGWLAPNNRYRLQGYKRIESDFASGTFRFTEVAKYIVVSAPHHCLDGWAFLGRAFHSLISGDPHTAFHLAYYAELRAAMSILATQGVGIFNRQHFVISNNNTLERVSRLGTHEITPLVLQEWARTPGASQLIGNIVRASSLSLGDWLSRLHSETGTASSYIAGSWLQEWGMDLRDVASDRLVRNEVSYRASGIRQLRAVDARSAITFVHDIWALLEPSTSFGFEYLDRYLVRKSLEVAYQTSARAAASKSLSSYKSTVKSLVNRAGLDGDDAAAWIKFLLRHTDPSDPLLMTYASTPADLRDSKYPMYVISRATLLLRIATGSCVDLFDSSGLDRGLIQFWWQAIGEDRGLWDSDDFPRPLQDKWADISDAIEEVNDWLNGDPSSTSYYGLRANCSHAVSVLTACEIAAMWGLNL